MNTSPALMWHYSIRFFTRERNSKLSKKSNVLKKAGCLLFIFYFSGVLLEARGENWMFTGALLVLTSATPKNKTWAQNSNKMINPVSVPPRFLIVAQLYWEIALQYSTVTMNLLHLRHGLFLFLLRRIHFWAKSWGNYLFLN